MELMLNKPKKMLKDYFPKTNGINCIYKSYTMQGNIPLQEAGTYKMIASQKKLEENLF
jgi:hypothetical protein